ncbi:MAG: hypothetical protein K6F34_03800 [Lachnospiraceae bacterium]|nr:hypothetical protein [Lachnospiraceae bacterium]
MTFCKIGVAILFVLHTIIYLTMMSPEKGMSGFNAYCITLVIMGIVMIAAVLVNKKNFYKIAFIAGAALGFISIIISFIIESVNVAIEGKIVTLCFVILNILFLLKILGVKIPIAVMIIGTVLLIIGVEFAAIDASLVIGTIFTLIGAGAYILTAFQIERL